MEHWIELRCIILAIFSCLHAFKLNLIYCLEFIKVYQLISHIIHFLFSHRIVFLSPCLRILFSFVGIFCTFSTLVGWLECRIVWRRLWVVCGNEWIINSARDFFPLRCPWKWWFEVEHLQFATPQRFCNMHMFIQSIKTSYLPLIYNNVRSVTLISSNWSSQLTRMTFKRNEVISDGQFFPPNFSSMSGQQLCVDLQSTLFYDARRTRRESFLLPMWWDNLIEDFKRRNDKCARKIDATEMSSECHDQINTFQPCDWQYHKE